MNKLKKVGLTALTTSLVASSAFAAELSVSGGASLNYSGINTTSDANPYTMGDSVTFSGSGDLDNGMTAGVSYELDGGNYDDYKLTLGMGDSGTITFSGNSVNAGGVDAVKDIVPNAVTPVYELANESGGAVDNGLATTSGRNTTSMWGYKVDMMGLGVNIGYNPKNSTAHQDAEQSIGLTYADAMDGLTLVAGRMDDGGVAENDTYGVKYTAGSVTVGYQKTDVDYDSTGTNDQSATHFGISVAINENLSVSAGQQKVDIDTAGQDEKNTGFMASYTMGSITLAGGFNDVEHGSGTANNDAEATFLNASFAF
jgi:outer membrane protein OmpU